MKFKKSYVILVGLLFLLTGCVKGDVNIDFKDENTVNMNIEVLFPQSFLSNYNTSIEELKKKLMENGLQEWSSEELKESINGITYTGLKLTAPESINKMLMSYFDIDDDNKNYQLKIDLNTINELYNTSELKDIDNYSLSNLKTMGLELDLNISMPGTIKEASIGKVNDDQVQINLIDLLTQDKISTISIISAKEHKSTFPINLLMIAGLLIILYLILRKRK